jgi:hypothetical protein
MKLYTESFKKYSKIIEKFHSNDDQKSKSIYLNFEDSFGYLINPNLAGRFAFKYEGDKIDNFFVDMEKFLTICQAYDFFEIDENLEFANGEDKFKLTAYNETFDLLNFDTTDYTTITIASDVFEALRLAVQFTGTNNIDSNYAGISMKEKRIISSDGYRVFETNHSVDFPSIKLPDYVLRIALIAESYGVNLLYKEDMESFFLSFDNNNFLVMAPTVESLLVPPVDEPFWVEGYNHATSFTVNKKELSDQMGFFKIFTSNLSTDPISFKIETENILILEAKGAEIAKRSIPIEDCSPEIVGESFMVMRGLTARALEAMPDEKIKIQFNPEQEPNRLINIVGTATNNLHVVAVLLSED